MIFISHRGNITGKNKEKENSPEYIEAALKKGYHVEVDVWYINKKWYLGHDLPQHEIEPSFLNNDKLWCHAKNIESLERMIEEDIHCFWHQEDDVTLTSRGYLWTYPGKKVTTKSIAVLPEIKDFVNIGIVAGICTDYPLLYEVQNKRGV